MRTNASVLAKKLSKLRESEPALERCRQQANLNHLKAAVCRSALQLIEPMLSSIEEAKWSGDGATAGGADALPADSIDAALKEVAALDVEARFSHASETMRLIRNEIQTFVNTKHDGNVVMRFSLLDYLINTYTVSNYCPLAKLD